MAVGIIGSKDPANPSFKGSKRKLTKRTPFFSPRNMAKGGDKISGSGSKTFCLQGILTVQLLVNILRSWHQGFWNSRWLVYLQHLCHLWLFSHLREPHQW